MTHSSFGLVLVPALLWVVVSDLLYRRISNRIVLALLTLWCLHMGWLSWQHPFAVAWLDVAWSLLAAVGVLVLGYGLFAMRWVGAGDVKLMAVLCLWTTPHAFTFLIVTSLAGGVLALGLPLLQWMETAFAHGVVRMSLRVCGKPLPAPVALRAHRTPGLPYGLAIAFGAAFTLYAQPT